MGFWNSVLLVNCEKGFFIRDVTSRGSNSNSTRSSNLYYCSIKARSSKFIFEPKLELARTRNKSSRVQPKYRCQSRTN